MSAWIVTRDHIDLIVTAALSWEAAVPEHADTLGQMLWRENAASVAYRYPNDTDSDRPGPIAFRDRDAATYIFTSYPGRVDPDVVAIACESLIYQSCEHPEWHDSQARAWLIRLLQISQDHTTNYTARYGPINPDHQPAGQHDWYRLIHQEGTHTVSSTDAWAIHDRDTFHRAAALREPPADQPAPISPRRSTRPSRRPTTEEPQP